MSAGDLGGRLRHLRTQQGLTQQELAEPAYTPAYISTIEAGRRSPSDVAIEYFATKLGVSAKELVSGISASFTAEAVARLQEGWRALYLGRYAEAKKGFGSVERDARRVHHVELEAKALVGRGRCEERQGQTSDALRLFSHALELLADEASLLAKVEAVAGVARCHQMSGDTRLAVHELETYLLQLERQGLPDPAVLMRTYASLVWPYVELGLHEKASDVATQALQLQTNVDDPEYLAGMHLNVARVLLNDGHIDTALDSLRKAEEMYADLNWQTEIARARTNRGMVHLSEGDHAAARSDFESALTTYQDVGFVRGEARTLNELARVARHLDDPESAERHARRAVELLSEMELVPELALAHRELGLAVRHDRPDEAVRHFRTAMDLYKDCGELLHAADTHRLLGDLLVSEKSPTAWGEYRKGLLFVADVLDRKDEVADLDSELEGLSEGSAWKQRIVNFLMTAEADDKMKEFVDDQVRMRMDELCRTEDRYIAVSKALAEAGLVIRDGKVLHTKDASVRPIEELLGAIDGNPASGGRIRVVVIDDSDPVRKALSKSLERHRDIELVGEADSGEAGLQVVAAVDPHVVIVDGQMPGMDGAETIKRLLALRPGIHIVGHSGEPSYEATLLDAGAELFVVKAGPVGELVDAIRRMGAMERTGEPR